MRARLHGPLRDEKRIEAMQVNVGLVEVHDNVLVGVACVWESGSCLSVAVMLSAPLDTSLVEARWGCMCAWVGEWV